MQPFTWSYCRIQLIAPAHRSRDPLVSDGDAVVFFIDIFSSRGPTGSWGSLATCWVLTRRWSLMNSFPFSIGWLSRHSAGSAMVTWWKIRQGQQDEKKKKRRKKERKKTTQLLRLPSSLRCREKTNRTPGPSKKTALSRHTAAPLYNFRTSIIEP